MSTILDKEEYIEQRYFFATLRQRMQENMATQEVLSHVHEEILSTTRLPYAIEFLSTELKHSGLLASGFERLKHYFTPYQAFIIREAEDDKRKFSMEIALEVLEREADYRAKDVSPAGLFIYQFESLSRNRLRYHEGLQSMIGDPLYDENWRNYLMMVQRQVGIVDFTDLIYLRSQWYVNEQQRNDPDYVPTSPPLFGEKEGKIAKANRGKEPLYMFAALQRQLGYPEVPRAQPPDNITAKLEELKVKLREMEQRVKLVESEVRGQLDLNQFMIKPDSFLGPLEDDTSV